MPIPATFTLPIANNDKINYQGTDYTVSSFTGPTNDAKGRNNYVITDSNGDVFTVSYDTCTLHYKDNQGVQHWKANI